MLFESGNGVAVDLQLFDAPRESARPIDAYVVTEVEGSVTRSARRAAGAAYEAVARHVSDLPAAVAGFDFGGSSQVIGESGGLAFAIALAKHLARQDPGPVAATGEVESSHNGGPVAGIRGIEAKLDAAAAVLPAGGHVFYPRENDGEVSAEARRKMVEQGLILHPVSSVAEAIDLLFFPDAAESSEDKGSGMPDKATGMSIFYLLFLLVVLFATAGLAVWQSQGPAPVTPSAEVSAPTVPVNQNEIPGQDAASKRNDEKTRQIGDDSNSGEMAAGRPETTSDETSGAFKTEETTPDKPLPASAGEDAALDSARVSIDISGNTSLNASISKALADKLEKFYSEQNHYLGPVETVEIAGQVYIMRVEETWIEETQNFRSNLRVEIRDLFYRDDKRTMPYRNIQVDVDGSGMVEDLISSAAQELMTKVLVAVSSKTESGTSTVMSPREPERPEHIEPPPRPARNPRSSSGFD